MAWSAIFIVIEVVVGAYAYAVLQAALLVTGTVLLCFYTRLIAKANTVLPAPANANDTPEQ